MSLIIAMIIICSVITTFLTIAIVVRELRSRSRKLSQRKAILDGGTSAQAVINSIRSTNAQLDDQPEVLLDLTVTKQDGAVIHTVVRTVIPIVHIPAFQAGQVIEVKYMTIDNEPKFEVVGAYVP
ncbi:hypothetical protein PAESOLCIP111_04418 [Paenibacillus solanacearum]|uniref:DUF3592 domain-containing protein n=1 Tax=Paenibacillus solanacearum TaxID=2048548 RepID=A0A916NKJ9_9BACL|nr:hypothetical protein [Paenibacillus solanacearum]CAG7643076.1 hypothetical protein PAESOLCIP111_04418 [Paenibacillus solanacearum]